jgi:hypothetical protein
VLLKILFTIVVVVGVALFFRNRNEAANPPPASRPSADGAPSTRAIAYVLIAILVAISVGVFVYKWQQDNRIVNIRVTTESGEVVNYQAHHKDIDGRKFLSLDGVQVTLGQGDRVEMLHR